MVTPLTQLTSMHDSCRQYRAVTNPIAGPAYLTNLFQGIDGTGISGTIAYMRTIPVGQIIAEIHRRLDLPVIPPSSSKSDSGPLPASGKGLTSEGSLGGSHGEFIERYVAIREYGRARKDGDIVVSTAAELRRRGPVVGPDSLALFAPAQYAERSFPFVPFDDDTRIGWVRGTDSKGEPVWIPAVLVFMGYRETPEEGRVAYPTTGGLCFGPSVPETRRTAVLELVERDAINLCWTSGVPPRRITKNVGATRYSAVRGDSRHLVFSPRTDVPGVSVVHAQYFDLESPLFLGGGGIDRTLRWAVTKALLEIKQCAHATEYLRHSPFDVGEDGVRDFFDVIPYYSHQSRIRGLLATMERVCAAGGAEVEMPLVDSDDRPNGRSDDDVDIVAEVERICGPVYFYSMGVEELGLPGVVMRCVAPGLTLAGVPQLQFLGHPRYYSGPSGDASLDEPLAFEHLNRRILPFP